MRWNQMLKLDILNETMRLNYYHRKIEFVSHYVCEYVHKNMHENYLPRI